MNRLAIISPWRRRERYSLIESLIALAMISAPRLKTLIARFDALLAAPDLPPETREVVRQARDGLAHALDGVHKMKAVIQSRATPAAAA